MQAVTEYIYDHENGSVMCAACLLEHGVAYEMAIVPNGYACDETATGHFLPADLVNRTGF